VIEVGNLRWTRYSIYPCLFPISHLVSYSQTVVPLYLDITLEMLFCQVTYQHNFVTTCKDDIPFPRSMILRIIHLLPSNPLELEVSSLKLLPGLESMGMTENGTYDVAAAVEADGRINVDSGSIFKLDTVTPGCDGAM
jgi:hypothetical protein